MTLRRLHRLNAYVLAVFIVAHMANHLVIVAGIDAHLAVMEQLRRVYRLPPIEYALIFLFFGQIGLGIAQVWRKRGGPGRWGVAQRVSGIVLAVFLLQHIGAAVVTRIVYPDVDTNSYWAASVVQGAPHAWYFVPYYIAGVTAMFVHAAVIMRFAKGGKRWVWTLIFVGPVIGTMIVAGLAGWIHPVELPQAHQSYIDNYWSR